jgi:hypothetical protein
MSDVRMKLLVARLKKMDVPDVFVIQTVMCLTMARVAQGVTTAKYMRLLFQEKFRFIDAIALPTRH